MANDPTVGCGDVDNGGEDAQLKELRTNASESFVVAVLRAAECGNCDD